MIGNARELVDPLADGIAPSRGLSRLKLEARQDVAVAFPIDVSFKILPLPNEILSLLCAFVMRIVDVLDHGFSRVQHMLIGYVMEEEKQLVGAGGQRFVDLLHGTRILADEPSARGAGPVHADALVIRPVPLAPAIVF